MDFLNQLTESKLLPSKTVFRKYTGRDVAELAYMHLLALRILSCEHGLPIVTQHVRIYAQKTNKPSGFKTYSGSQTDLYMLLNALIDKDIKLHDDYAKSLSINTAYISAWLRSISIHDAHPSEAAAERLFSNIDGMFKMTDHILRSIRRLVMHWPTISHREKQLAFTRLIQKFRAKAMNSDLYYDLNRVDKLSRLELRDVCDPETGEGCPVNEGEEYKRVTLANVAQLMAEGYLVEDDGGGAAAAPAAGGATAGATTSGDIATFVGELGGSGKKKKTVRRR